MDIETRMHFLVNVMFYGSILCALIFGAIHVLRRPDRNDIHFGIWGLPLFQWIFLGWIDRTATFHCVTICLTIFVLSLLLRWVLDRTHPKRTRAEMLRDDILEFGACIDDMDFSDLNDLRTLRDIQSELFRSVYLHRKLAQLVEKKAIAAGEAMVMNEILTKADLLLVKTLGEAMKRMSLAHVTSSEIDALKAEVSHAQKRS